MPKSTAAPGDPRGGTPLNLGASDRALAAWRAIAAADPASLRARARVATCLVGLGRLDEARPSSRRSSRTCRTSRCLVPPGDRPGGLRRPRAALDALDAAAGRGLRPIAGATSEPALAGARSDERFAAVRDRSRGTPLRPPTSLASGRSTSGWGRGMPGPGTARSGPEPDRAGPRWRSARRHGPARRLLRDVAQPLRPASRHVAPDVGRRPGRGRRVRGRRRPPRSDRLRGARSGRRHGAA